MVTVELAMPPPRQERLLPMDNGLPSLITPTPTEGYELAVKPARIAVKKTQSESAVRDRLRKEYEADADADPLIADSQVVATHFATIAAANDYWRVVA